MRTASERVAPIRARERRPGVVTSCEAEKSFASGRWTSRSHSGSLLRAFNTGYGSSGDDHVNVYGSVEKTSFIAGGFRDRAGQRAWPSLDTSLGTKTGRHDAGPLAYPFVAVELHVGALAGRGANRVDDDRMGGSARFGKHHRAVHADDDH